MTLDRRIVAGVSRTNKLTSQMSGGRTYHAVTSAACRAASCSQLMHVEASGDTWISTLKWTTTLGAALSGHRNSCC